MAFSENARKARANVKAVKSVKCQYTGEWGKSNTFFQAPDKTYYKSEKIYEFSEREKDTVPKIIDFIHFHYLDWEPARQAYETKIKDKLREYRNKGYFMVDVYNTLEKKEEDITRAMSKKGFTGDEVKLRYLFAVVDNHIDDIVKERKRLKKEKEHLERIAQKRAMNAKRFNDQLEILDNPPKQKGKDISQFVE